MTAQDKPTLLSRRGLLHGGAIGVAALSLPLTAAKAAEAETIALWPGDPPGGNATTLQTVIEKRSSDVSVYSQIATPFLLVYRPKTPNGSAVVLAQGGGYVHIANSPNVPAFLTAQGITVFDLIYRLPSEGWKNGPEAPKQDGQRALRLARKLAPQYGVDPNRIGVMGFSAGGHVAATLATTFQQKAYAAYDDADLVSARPDFAVLSCPVITMSDPFAHGGSRRLLLGDKPEPARAAYSCEQLVTAETPPCFLVHANDDKVVPADNSILMALALRRAAVPVELHLYREGGHGMGTGLSPELPASHWTDAMQRWLTRYVPAKA